MAGNESAPEGAIVLNTYATENFEAAKVGDKTYNSLQAAINAAEENATIILSNDVKLDSFLEIGKSITLNLNGHTIYNTEEIYNGENKHWSLLSITESANVTIDGGTFRALANDCFAVDVRDSASLTINGGTFVGNLDAIYLHGSGIVTINGGTFSIQQKHTSGDPYQGVLNRRNDATGQIVVNGGKFQGFDPSKSPCGTGEVKVNDSATVTETKEVFGGVEYTYYVVTSNSD